MIGLPSWFVIGILLTFWPEFGKVLGISVPVLAGKAVMFGYIGLSLGDLSSGILSQYFKSRKKVVLIFLLLTSLFIALFLLQSSKNAAVFYGLCLFLGFSIGFWALFVTISAEQFGTNLRATVATTVPNFVRGSVNIFTPLFLLGKSYWGVLPAAGAVGGLTIAVALLALWGMEETFHKDLDYFETT
jgi:MFS family permease